ncbi:hypothetical protein [Dyadobacter sp. LHD-138]|uniref:hypothetical protein n=1 Tax=Dyadobacter sp. LHD-138 TaxID=3071413 RepID=UPI0027E135FA|nr:hypothetical protein [Dyadobacter sp. LHD-138]MDQ6482560.1 hypothetical protein [Dyadobacter sp. LHD-138]
MSITCINLGIAQVPQVEKDLNLDSLMLDSKILLVKNQLPKGWQLEHSDKRLYILYHEKVWFPITYVQDRKVISNTTSYEYRNGKKVIVVEANPCFILEVMPIWTKEQWKDTIIFREMNEIKKRINQSWAITF